jgi:hypothetical protein
MRTLLLLIILVMVAALAVLSLPGRMWPPTPMPTPQPQPVVVRSQGPTIERLEQLSHLVATRVLVADVLVGEGNGCKGAWLIRGDALIAVDLSKASVVEKNETAKRATIRLPLPEVLQARVDHERTQIWELKSTTWIPWASDKDSLRDTVMAHAQRLVGHAAGSAENIQQAKASAEAVIRGFWSEVGWTISVTWADSPSESQKVAAPTKP